MSRPTNRSSKAPLLFLRIASGTQIKSGLNQTRLLERMSRLADLLLEVSALRHREAQLVLQNQRIDKLGVRHPIATTLQRPQHASLHAAVVERPYLNSRSARFQSTAVEICTQHLEQRTNVRHPGCCLFGGDERHLAGVALVDLASKALIEPDQVLSESGGSNCACERVLGMPGLHDPVNDPKFIRC